MTLFQKARMQALKACQKEIDKQIAKFGEAKYDNEDYAIIAALQDWPVTSKQIRGLDVKYKAILAKAHLASTYPENTFSARIDRYSMGSALDIYWKGPAIDREELRKFENLYADAGKTDSQSDCFDYDNHIDIKEDFEQHSARYETFPQCHFCKAKYEEMNITSEGKNMCHICISNAQHYGVSSFQSLISLRKQKKKEDF